MTNNHNWNTKKMQELASFEGGGTPSRKKSEYFEKGTIPWVKTLDLNNAIISRTEECITELGLKKSSCRTLPKDSILIAMYGGFNQIGRTGLLSIEATVNQAITAIILDKNKLLPRYLLFYLNFNVQKWKKFAVSSRKDPNITKEDIKKMLISFPSAIYEQRRIVEVLETWDKAIQLTRKLIEQKELQKKYLMQQLLTGRTRLNGITTTWKEVKLGSLLKEISQRNKKLTVKQVLSVTNTRGFVLPKDQFSKEVASADLSNYKVVSHGEFAYNPSRVNVGSIAFLESFEKGILSPMYIVFKCSSKILSLYFKHWLKTEEFILKVSRAAQGSVRSTVDFNSLSTIKIKYPTSISEQRSIANVLSFCDKEIDLLRQKLVKLEEQKKGLMQILLTGKVRLNW